MFAVDVSMLVKTKPPLAVILPFTVTVSAVASLPNVVFPVTDKLSSMVTSPLELRILLPFVSNLSFSFKSPPLA